MAQCLDAAIRCPRAAPPDALDLGANDKARAYAALIATVEAAQQQHVGGVSPNADADAPAVIFFLDAIRTLHKVFPPLENKPAKPQKPRRARPAADVHLSKSMPPSPVASRISSRSTETTADGRSASGSTTPRLPPPASAAPVLVRPSAVPDGAQGSVSRQTSAPPLTTETGDVCDGMMVAQGI